MKEKITCTLCGFRCSSDVTGGRGRLLEDLDRNLYINAISINDCRVRHNVNKGIPGNIARESMPKGDRLT